MKTFEEHLRNSKSILKARREYMAERKWRTEDWYRNWNQLGPEIEAACLARTANG